MTAAAQRRPSVKSNVSSTMTEILAWRPRLFLLIGGFITMCAVTVGVLGWQLTMTAGKDNVASMMEEIEFLISNQVSTYILQASETLTAITHMQKSYFEIGQWSFATPEIANKTHMSMLIALNAVSQYTTSMYILTYPRGEQFGYFYHTDVNGTRTLRWWSQEGMTVSVNLCTEKGEVIQPPISVRTNEGNGTLKNPGNNNTLQNAVGGISGVDLEYAIGPTFGYSNVYLFDGEVYKSAYAYSINPVTQESVVFGNDWTLNFISKAIVSMLKVVVFPMFSAIIECDTGTVVATSSMAQLFVGDQLLTIQQINDPFLQDFAGMVNGTFSWAGKTRAINDLPSQMRDLYAFIEEYYPGSQAAYTDRTINGENWKMALNTYTIIGNKMLFVTYMNTDSVEAELNQLSAKTGYMMIGIISAFVVVGILFTLMITRQLHVVSVQIRLLKDLKFKEVLGVDAEIKNRSFIYELAELQKCFHSMVIVFSELLKSNSSMRQPTTGVTTSDHAQRPNVAPRTFGSQMKETEVGTLRLASAIAK
ncbi:UNVERIFIED_CONTAM: hypothetical protein HDU68_002409 [Siphonaria sp. JEL0065]|nr:hypothetical protein HDU68_002409 [Siphonaria sp. JEL0065]